MIEHRLSFRRMDLVYEGRRPKVATSRSGGSILGGLAVSFLALVLAGCGGGGSAGGTAQATGAPGVTAAGAAALTASTALNTAITGVSINGTPVVNFTVTNQAGVGMAGLGPSDLRFNIAKLVPGSNGGPSTWQNYINRSNGGAVQGSQERKTTTAGYVFGTLINKGNGNYTYTFATDITSATCPPPCTDADGNALDVSYQPGLTHRVTIQQANSAYPTSTGVFDSVPNGGIGIQRDIVASATCNQCHDQLTAHGTRVDTRLCVTCHNPGSWVAGAPNVPVDFKVMIHRIHYNIFNSLNTTNPALPNFLSPLLPSVFAGTPYKIGSTDFSTPVFPQDVRNCTKCHDGTAGSPIVTPQGDNWKMQPSMQACGACHDDVYFGTKPDPAKPYQTKAHPGGVMTDNSACALCHAAGKFSDNKDIVIAHNFPTRLAAAAAKFKFNIIGVTQTTAGSMPVITFSVTDPTNGDRPYDLNADPAFTATKSGASRLAVSIGWNTPGTLDFGNDGNTQNYGQPVGINLLGNAAVAIGAAPGTYTVTSTVAIPAAQTGTLRVTIDGHPAGDVTIAGTFADRLPVTNVYKDFAVTGAVTPRRTVVDIAKCDVCHAVLSLHGNNRTDQPGVCVVCHNPNATDAGQRPKDGTGALNGSTLTSSGSTVATDGKNEESIDFKTMIHAIHAGESDKGGFRTKGISIYGFGGRVNDFSGVVFPGKLNDCSNCHVGTSYQLTGTWVAPAAGGILGSTISTGASTTDSTDNLRISPTAAVCSSCHDSDLAKNHMQDPNMGGSFSVTQAAINATSEHCVLCHGVGSFLDVQTVHGVQ